MPPDISGIFTVISMKPLSASPPNPITSPDVEAVWRQYDHDEQRLTAPLSQRMLDLAQLAPGMQVLDLASGRGEPAIPAAHRVGAGGSVLGLDLDQRMLQMARERASREGLTNLELRVADIEQAAGVAPAHFHAVLARWVLMYLSAPVAALQQARRAMRPGALLVAAVWAEPQRVAYYSLPRQVLAHHSAVPAPDMTRPGTFYYADAATLQRDFNAAGLQITHIEEQNVEVMETASAAGLITWTRAFGMTRLLQHLAPQVQQAWETDMAIQAEKLRRDGLIRLGGITRIVVATAV